MTMRRTILPGRIYFRIIVLIILVVSPAKVNAQGKPPKPPKPIKVEAVATLSFGAFYAGDGGTVTVSATGIRNVGGTVVPLSIGSIPSSAEISILGDQYTILAPLYDTNVPLISETGDIMYFDIDSSSPVSPIILYNDRPIPNIVNLGATLTVGDASSNGPGNYTGTFNVIFNLQ